MIRTRLDAGGGRRARSRRKRARRPPGPPARMYRHQAEYGAAKALPAPCSGSAAAAQPRPRWQPRRLHLRRPSPTTSEESLEAEQKSASRVASQDVTVVPRKTSSTTSAYSVPLALNEPPALSRGPVLTDPYLPAVSAGGLDYVYQAPTKATIPSSRKQVAHPARVADVPGHRLPRGDARAGADRVPARARAQRRQAPAAARAGDDLRRRRAGRRRRDPDHRPGRRHRVPAGRRPGRQAGAAGGPDHQDHRRDHRSPTRPPTTSRSRPPTTRSRR